MKLCIDAGHGGRDPGAVGKSPFILPEKDVTLAIAGYTRMQFNQAGGEAVMTRRADRSLALSSRARFANRYGADVFVSIHANAAANDSAEGIEVFHYPGSAPGTRFAGAVLDSLCGVLADHRNRGVKEADFAVLRLTRMPAILVECEFISNPRQLEFLSAIENQEKIAAAIAAGVNAFTT